LERNLQHSCTLIVLIVAALASCGPNGQFAVDSSNSSGGPLTISSLELPKGFVGQPFFARLTAQGGTEPYTWSIFSGTLADGLSLDPATGVISGTPTHAEKVTFTAIVRDSSLLQTNTALATIENAVVCSSLTILTEEFPPAWKGRAYQAQFAACGGVTPYTWSIAEGSLPPGLTLDPLSGKVTGVPTQFGEFGFAIQVEDSGPSPMTVIARFGRCARVPCKLSRAAAGWGFSHRQHRGEALAGLILPPSLD
jgi:hypothetical protein